jgi:UDP-2,3-diacylglucosamine pyrophosphatase LpxH
MRPLRTPMESLPIPEPGRPRPVRPVRARRHRALFISDTHLGTRGCKAELLADFLRHNDCQTLYLVGDIIDGWQLKKGWYWSESNSEVVRTILDKVQDGTRIVYVPGNHDEDFRDYCGLTLGDIEVRRDAMHRTADGRVLLVTHGDQFDGIIAHARWLAHLGDWAYSTALVLNDAFNAVRCRLGFSYWSVSAYLKHKVKKAASFISNFEETLAREARERGVDGVVCGHIHHAEMKEIDGVLYCNDGDWVESCTALTEDFRGRLAILRWTELAGIATDAAALLPEREPQAA